MNPTDLTFRDLDTDTTEYRGDLNFKINDYSLEAHVRGVNIYMAKNPENLDGQVIVRQPVDSLNTQPLFKPTSSFEQTSLSLAGTNAYVYKL